MTDKNCEKAGYAIVAGEKIISFLLDGKIHIPRLSVEKLDDRKHQGNNLIPADDEAKWLQQDHGIFVEATSTVDKYKPMRTEKILLYYMVDNFASLPDLEVRKTKCRIFLLRKKRTIRIETIFAHFFIEISEEKIFDPIQEIVRDKLSKIVCGKVEGFHQTALVPTNRGSMERDVIFLGDVPIGIFLDRTTVKLPSLKIVRSLFREKNIIMEPRFVVNAVNSISFEELGLQDVLLPHESLVGIPYFSEGFGNTLAYIDQDSRKILYPKFSRRKCMIASDFTRPEIAVVSNGKKYILKVPTFAQDVEVFDLLFKKINFDEGLDQTRVFWKVAKKLESNGCIEFCPRKCYRYPSIFAKIKDWTGVCLIRGRTSVEPLEVDCSLCRFSKREIIESLSNELIPDLGSIVCDYLYDLYLDDLVNEEKVRANFDLFADDILEYSTK
jgi:hypothetical protein